MPEAGLCELVGRLHEQLDLLSAAKCLADDAEHPLASCSAVRTAPRTCAKGQSQLGACKIDQQFSMKRWARACCLFPSCTYLLCLTLLPRCFLQDGGRASTNLLSLALASCPLRRGQRGAMKGKIKFASCRATARSQENKTVSTARFEPRCFALRAGEADMCLPDY